MIETLETRNEANLGGRPAIGDWGLRIGDSSPRGRGMSNEPNFADGLEAPRRHREHRDVSKCNFYKELGLMLCGLCVSVVKDEAGGLAWGGEKACGGNAHSLACNAPAGLHCGRPGFLAGFPVGF